jgi:hypothetical protein
MMEDVEWYQDSRVSEVWRTESRGPNLAYKYRMDAAIHDSEKIPHHHS